MGKHKYNDDLSEISSAVGNAANSLLLGCGHQLAHLGPCHTLGSFNFPLDSLGFLSSVNDVVSNILALSSYITRHFLSFIEYLVHSDVDRYLDDFAFFPNSYSRSSMDCTYESVSDECSSSSDPGLHQRKPIEVRRQFPVNGRWEVIEVYNNRWGVNFIFQGLLLPVLCVRVTLKFAVASWRLSLSHFRHVQLQLSSVMSRVQRTLHGSSDDIGWLQDTSGMSPVEDGTSRFLEILEAVRNGEHRLPNSFVYLLIPGLFSNHGPLYFVGTKRFFSKMGLTCHIAKIHSEASVEHNAWELKQYVEELYWGSGKRVMLLGHSKGGVDAAAALSMFWSDLKGKVAGLALVQSPYGGTPIASDILREGQIADKEARRIMELIVCKLIKGDIRALEDLTYEKRKEFILKNKLPEGIPLISFHSEARIAPGILATMTRITHAELPWLRILNFGSENSGVLIFPGRQVPVVIPLSAAMAVCALHLWLRYREKSDGVVTCRDAEVPGSVVIIPDRKLDHAWMVYSSLKKNPSEPDASDMCEAILTLLVELDTKQNERTKGD